MSSTSTPVGNFEPVACCAMTRGGICHMIRPIAEQEAVQSFCDEMGQLFILLSADGVTNTKLTLSQHQKGLPVYLLGNLPEMATLPSAPACGDVCEAVMWVHGWNACRAALQANASLLPTLPDPLNDDRIGTTTNSAFSKGWNALREVMRNVAPGMVQPEQQEPMCGFNTGDAGLDALLDTVCAIATGPTNMDVAQMMLDQVEALKSRLSPLPKETA